MATIRKRTTKDGETRYQAMIRRAGFPMRTETFSTRVKAQKWVRLIEGQMEDGRHFRSAEAKRRTLGDAIDRYIKDEVPNKRSDGEMHSTCLKWWKDELGHLKLAEITSALAVEYRDKLKDRKHRGKLLSGARVNRYVAAARHLFTVARKRWHWVNVNPFSDVDMLPEDKGRVRYLSDDERKALLAETAKDSVLHTFVVIALSTACRAGELLKLEWRDVDLKAEKTTATAAAVSGRLLFRKTKNAQPRSAWISDLALDLLKEHGKVRQLHGGPVFPLTKRGNPYDYSKPFRAAVAAAGIKNFRFHDCRHSAATWLAQAGATEQQLRAIGGWKSNVVSRYVHLAAEDSRSAFQGLADKVGK
jgi:integrase